MMTEDPQQITRVHEWMKKALTLAQEARDDDEVPVGAVILDKNGNLIGEGRNLREKGSDPTAHAEIVAIRNACQSIDGWRLEGCTLIVTLEPCPMCLAAAHQSRLSRIIYAAHDPKGGAISLGYHLHSDERTNHRFQIEQIEFPECGKILSDFFREKRKKG
jgi:tRNA(adenine34) deaminase